MKNKKYIEMEKDFIKYEKYVYKMLKISNDHIKIGNRSKISLYNAYRMGYTYEDLIQEGKKMIWEALLKYDSRKKASKSTFIFIYLKNRLINIAISFVQKKRTGINVYLDNIINTISNDNISGEDLILFKEKYKERLINFYENT